MKKKDILTKGSKVFTMDGVYVIQGFNGTHLEVFCEEWDFISGEVDYGYKFMTISDLERAVYETTGRIKHFVYEEE